MAAPLPAGSDAFAAALRIPLRCTHPVTHFEVLETHISWVILTGTYAYKIKKPVSLGFADFSTLESRHRYCEEELRLNRRLAPGIYEAVVPLTGGADGLTVGGKGVPIEFAVKMREFPQSALASRMLAGGQLGPEHVAALAARLAAFHAEAGVAARGCSHGTPDAVIEDARENFTQLDVLLPAPADRKRLTELREWTEREHAEHWACFNTRHAQGSVRECHGDLHLGNIVMLDSALTPFDCIEFNPALRWIDVMSDIAFLAMDLTDRTRADLAAHLLNAYLEASGDHAGIEVLRFYLVYRALVRAKVHALRAVQHTHNPPEGARLIAASRDYVRLAQRCASQRQPAIILMHGLSGSGKSALAQSCAQHIGAFCLRSDIERKRIAGVAPAARSRSGLDAGLYTVDLTGATYHRLLDLTRMGVNAGYPVIVDATFLKRWQRDLFRREAGSRNVPFIIIDVVAPEAVLHSRIAARLAQGGDASEANAAVLRQQRAQAEALTAEESSRVVCIDSASADVRTTRQQANQALRTLLGTPTPSVGGSVYKLF